MLYWQLRRQTHAAIVADITYALWEKWHTSPVGATRGLALAAKCHSVVQWDRVMFGGRKVC